MFQWLKGINGSDTAKDAPRPVNSDVNDLKGQVAVISGSTSGIGLALARAVASRGGDVVLNGLGDPAEIERTRTPQLASISARVRSISEGSPSPFSTTSPPREAMARAKARPIPEVEPEITAT